MRGGVLEVLLCSAEGLKDARFLGSKHYVIIQCGSQAFTSKTTTGEHSKVWWNEKFTFKFSSADWKDITKLKLHIMEKDKFLEDRSVGEATVYLRGIIKEGSKKSSLELKPAPYNVVLKDGSFEGELKVGLKFISNVEMDVHTERRGFSKPENVTQSLYRTILSFALRRIPWPSFLSCRTRAVLADSKKG